MRGNETIISQLLSSTEDLDQVEQDLLDYGYGSIEGDN